MGHALRREVNSRSGDQGRSFWRHRASHWRFQKFSFGGARPEIEFFVSPRPIAIHKIRGSKSSRRILFAKERKLAKFSRSFFSGDLSPPGSPGSALVAIPSGISANKALFSRPCPSCQFVLGRRDYAILRAETNILANIVPGSHGLPSAKVNPFHFVEFQWIGGFFWLSSASKESEYRNYKFFWEQQRHFSSPPVAPPPTQLT